jgi:hypothetical protein
MIIIIIKYNSATQKMYRKKYLTTIKILRGGHFDQHHFLPPLLQPKEASTQVQDLPKNVSGRATNL